MAHIAHEIKNPLLIIGGFARQLLKAPGFDDQARRKLSIMAEEVSHLEEMVAEMRDFVHHPATQKRPGQITAVVDEALELFQDTFKEHNIQVRRVEETPLPPVAFDPKQVHQVLINLLKNAVEAMPTGGEITITSRVKGDQRRNQRQRHRRGAGPGGGRQYFSALFHHQGKGDRTGAGHLPEYHGRARRLHLCRQPPGPGSYLHHPTALTGDLPGCGGVRPQRKTADRVAFRGR